MIGAVGSPSFTGAIGTGTSTSVLESQLVQCERQLSDWTHCVSAKTPEGKATIQALSDKASAIKKRIEEADNAKPGSQEKASVATNPNQGGAAPKKPAADDASSASAVRSTDATVGRLINVFA
ncbi:MAG: hypothetical protein KGZ83_01520 [Sulfuricella sp.]|nr:hypothetical protein [Sulfuricella sp.]